MPEIRRKERDKEVQEVEPCILLSPTARKVGEEVHTTEPYLSSSVSATAVAAFAAAAAAATAAATAPVLALRNQAASVAVPK